MKIITPTTFNLIEKTMKALSEMDEGLKSRMLSIGIMEWEDNNTAWVQAKFDGDDDDEMDKQEIIVFRVSIPGKVEIINRFGFEDMFNE